MKAGWSETLEKLTRRADPMARLVIEAVGISADDVRHLAEDWAGSDSNIGVRIQDDGSVVLEVSGNSVSEITASTSVLTFPTSGTDSYYAVIEYTGRDAHPVITQLTFNLVSQKNPASPLEVVKWSLELFAIYTETREGEFILLNIAPVYDTFLVDAVGSITASDILFDFTTRARKLPQFPSRPAYTGKPDHQSSHQYPTILALLKPLKGDGSRAANAGMSIGVTGSGAPYRLSLTTLSTSLQRNYPGLMWDEGTTGAQAPRMSVTTAAYQPATVGFTLSYNLIDLGSLPAGDVEFVGQGDTPGPTSILYQVRATDGAWVTFSDGDLADTDNTPRGGVNLSATGAHRITVRQTYEMRATLSPGSPPNETPVLRLLGARVVEIVDLEGLTRLTGGTASVDPVGETGGEVPEAKIEIIHDGQRDYLDVATDLFARFDIANLEFRCWWGGNRIPRTQWMLLDTFVVDDYDPKEASVTVTVLGVLQYVLTVVPPPVVQETLVTRNPKVYANQTLPSIYSDLLSGQIGLPERYLGVGIPDSELHTASKRLDNAQGKDELDAIAYLAGGAVISSQGRVKFVDLHGDKPVVAFFPRSEISPISIAPGLRLRVPEFFVPYQWVQDDTGVGNSRYISEIRSFHSEALLRMGSARLDPPRRLGDTVARWVDTNELAELVASRMTSTLGPGLILWSFGSAYPYPELEVGDAVAVEADWFIARDPVALRELRGRIWTRGVIARVHDIEGRGFDVWVRKYSDLIPSSVSVDNSGFRRTPVLRGFDIVEKTDAFTTYGWDVPLAGEEVWGAYRTFTEPVPPKPWALVKADALPLSSNRFRVPNPPAGKSLYLQVEPRRFEDLVEGKAKRLILGGTTAPLGIRVEAEESGGNAVVTVTVNDPRSVVDKVQFYRLELGVRSGPYNATSTAPSTWVYSYPLDTKHPIGIQPEVLRLDAIDPVLLETYTSDIDKIATVIDIRRSRAVDGLETILVDADTDTSTLWYKEDVGGILGAETSIATRLSPADPRFGAFTVQAGATARKFRIYGKDAAGVVGDYVDCRVEPFLSSAPFVVEDYKETDTTATRWVRVTARGIAVSSVEAQTQIGAGNPSTWAAPTRGPGGSSVVKGGTLGAGEYEQDVALDLTRFSRVNMRLTLATSEVISMGGRDFDRGSAPTLVLVTVAAQKVTVVGDTDTKSLKLHRTDVASGGAGYWEAFVDGISAVFDVAGVDSSGAAGIGSSVSWPMRAVVYSEPKVSVVVGTTPQDQKDITVAGASASAEPTWLTSSPAAPASSGSSVVTLNLKASSAPGGYTAKIWYRARTGASWPSFADRSSSVSPAITAPPTTLTAYTYDTAVPRADSGSYTVYVQFKAEILNGSGVVVATSTVTVSWNYSGV